MTLSKSSPFLQSLVETHRRIALEDGIEAAIWQYYDDYTDATELDPEFIAALKVVTGDGAYISKPLEQIVDDAEQAVREDGREVFTVDGDDGVL